MEGARKHVAKWSGPENLRYHFAQTVLNAALHLIKKWLPVLTLNLWSYFPYKL